MVDKRPLRSLNDWVIGEADAINDGCHQEIKNRVGGFSPAGLAGMKKAGD
jgi:hypothetical protein